MVRWRWFTSFIIFGVLVACGQIDSDPIPTVKTQANSYTLQDLGSLGGTYSTAYAISENGAVAGASSMLLRKTHAFFWTEAGGMRDLGTLGGDFSRALGVNDSGRVVGEAVTSSGEQHAFLWSEAEGMRDLGTLLLGKARSSRALPGREFCATLHRLVLQTTTNFLGRVGDT